VLVQGQGNTEKPAFVVMVQAGSREMLNPVLRVRERVQKMGKPVKNVTAQANSNPPVHRCVKSVTAVEHLQKPATNVTERVHLRFNVKNATELDGTNFNKQIKYG
jgi:hypothetical protein